MLHEVNIAETKGSGIRVMRQLMEESKLLPPNLESDRPNDRFVATFLFHHFLGPEDLAWLGGLTPETLSDEEARALVFVRETGAIDNATYRDINQTDTLDASTHLRRLRNLELLEKRGSGSRTYYEPGRAFQPGPRAGSGVVGSEAHQPGPRSREADAQSHVATAQSHQPGAQSHQPEPRLVTRDDLPTALSERLPNPGQRPGRDALRTLIVDLCTARPLSARNLAALLGRRDHKPLIRDHLTPLIEAGRLRYTVPEMPKHPQQAYTAAPEETAE